MNKTFKIITLALTLGLATLIAFLFLKALTLSVGANGWDEEEPYVLCHNNPAQSITLEFQNEQSYEGHLGQPHNDQVYDTEGPCEEDFDVCPLVQDCLNEEECHEFLVEACEEEEEVEGFNCNDLVDYCEVPYCTLFPNGEECQEQPTPTPTASPSATPTPEVTEAPRGETLAEQCTDTKPNKAPDNFHIYRKGDVARPVWFYDTNIGWRVVVYYGLTGQGDQHSKIFKNVSDNQELIEALGSRDFDFRATFLNGCAEGPSTNAVIDGSTLKWYLFR